MPLTPRAKFWLWTGLLSATLLGLCGWLYWFVDGPEPDDADVRWAAPGPLPPPEQNGYLLVEQWPKESLQDRLDKIDGELPLYPDLVLAYNWQDVSARKLVAASMDLRECLQKAVGMPAFMAPGYKVWVDDSISSKMHEAVQACFLALQAELKDGNVEAALDWAGIADAAIRRLADSGEGFSAMNAALVLWNEEAEILIFNLPWRQMGRAELARVANLGLSENEGVKIGRVYLCAWHEEFTRAVFTAKKAGNFAILGRRGKPVPTVLQYPLAAKRFLPNETRRIHADWARYDIEHGLAVPFELSSMRYVDRLHALVGETKYAGWVVYGKRNLPGLVFFLDSLSVMSLNEFRPFVRLPETYLRRLGFAMSALRALVALRQFEIDHGTLPETSAELVPNYLVAWPRDPFDLQPLRYSAATRRLWSVGTDNLDHGGGDTDAPVTSEYDPRPYFDDEEQPTVPIFPEPLTARAAPASGPAGAASAPATP